MIKRIKIIFTILFLSKVIVAQDSQTLSFSVDSCIKYAFENSAFLKSGQQEVLSGKEDIKIRKSKSYPIARLYGDYGFTNQYTDINLEPIIPNTGDEYVVSNLGIEVYQPIWQNNKLNLQTEMSEIRNLIALNRFKTAQLNLIYSIQVQYVNLLQQQQLQQLSLEMADRIAVYVQSANERFNVGTARKSEILKSETEYSNSLVIVNRYGTEKMKIEKSLLKSIGANLNITLSPENFLEDTLYDASNFSTDSLISSAFENLPEYDILNQSILNQEVSVKYQKRLTGPELGLYAKYGWQQTPMPIVEDSWFGYAGLKLNYTIFNGNSKKHRVTREKIKLAKYEYKREEIGQIILMEIQQAILVLNETRKLIENTSKQLENSSVNLDITRGEYEEGVSSMLELLEAENAHFVANQNHINALSEYHRAYFALERKSGINSYKYSFD